jgi:adenine deaminase
VGIDDDDILAALGGVVAAGGGLAVGAGGRVLAAVPLEVAGLMTDQPPRETAARVRSLEAEIRRLGVQAPHPFGVLSFLALPVIPALRLTDLGLVDVATGTVVPVALD